MTPLEVLRRYPAHADTLTSVLETRAAVDPSRPLIVFGDRMYTYRAVQELVCRAAAHYASLGVVAGDRVATMSRSHPATPLTFLALARLGAIMVGINPDYSVEEARFVLHHAAVKGVLRAESLDATVRGALHGLEGAPFVLDVDAFEASLPSVEAPPDVGEAGATVVLVYTSGTTGFPKGVMHNQRNVVRAGEGFVERMHLVPDDRMLCVLPMFHINALFYSFAGALAAGATLILESRFSASSFWATVARTGATEANTLAAISSILTRRSRTEFVPGHRLQKIYGAPFTAETHRVFRDEFGVPTLIEGYGMSEVPGVLHNPFLGPHRVGSMGTPSRHPDPEVSLSKVRVVDADGRDVADGVTGELVIQTPLVMQGYYRDPEQTAAAFRDGWFLSGDLVQRDADGYVWFVARQKDILRVRGENVSGAEIDRVASEHPSVLEAAAIPVASELGEDDILLAVVARVGAPNDAYAIAEFIGERLAAIKVPRFIVFVDALPKTATHRVEKYKMRADATLGARAVDVRKLTAPRS